jgi:hypothetical protein
MTVQLSEIIVVQISTFLDRYDFSPSYMKNKPLEVNKVYKICESKLNMYLQPLQLRVHVYFTYIDVYRHQSPVGQGGDEWRCGFLTSVISMPWLYRVKVVVRNKERSLIIHYPGVFILSWGISYPFILLLYVSFLQISYIFILYHTVFLQGFLFRDPLFCNLSFIDFVPNHLSFNYF